MNISNIVVQTIKQPLTIKPEMFPGQMVITLKKVEEKDGKKSKSRTILFSPDALDAISKEKTLENVIGTDYNFSGDIKFVLAGTNDDKIKLEKKRVITAYKLNMGTRTVLSKKLWDTISERFAVDPTEEDVNFLLTEVDGVFTLSPYIKPELTDAVDVELTIVTHEGK